MELKISDGNFCTCYDFSFCAEHLEIESYCKSSVKNDEDLLTASRFFSLHFHLSVLTYDSLLHHKLYSFFFVCFIKIWEWIVLILFLNYSFRTLYSSSSVWFLTLAVLFFRSTMMSVCDKAIESNFNDKLNLSLEPYT